MENRTKLIEERDDIIEHLNNVLKMNDSLTVLKSVELIQKILNINSLIKIEEDILISNIIK